MAESFGRLSGLFIIEPQDGELHDPSFFRVKEGVEQPFRHEAENPFLIIAVIADVYPSLNLFKDREKP